MMQRESIQMNRTSKALVIVSAPWKVLDKSAQAMPALRSPRVADVVVMI